MNSLGLPQSFKQERRSISPPAEKFIRLDLAELFGNEQPLEIEIGCGKGKFLVSRAEATPERNFLGIDRISKWMKIGEQRSLKRRLENLRFLKADAREILKGHIPAASVQIFHIYFPDPWPKRRHRHRRVVNSDLLSLLHERLVPQGFVEIATDDFDYFSQIKQVLSETSVLWSAVREAVNERFCHESFKTNYELKFEAAGRPLYYLEMQK